MTATIKYDDVALIFEGGAMRNAYTCAVVTTLIKNGIHFPKAYGISAGAVLAAAYVAGEDKWAKAMFTESVKNPKAGGSKSFIEGKGFFNLQYMLEGLSEINAYKDSVWTFDFKTFRNSDTDIHIEALDKQSGKTKAWTKKDMHTLTDTMMSVAASCAYPLFTNSIEIDGRHYVDGGMGSSHGICLEAAIKDGFKRFFIVRTQPRNYRMDNLSFFKKLTYKIAYIRYPKVYKAIRNRPRLYNSLLDKIRGVRNRGDAYVFCPSTMPITYKTVEYDKLIEAYDLGMKQCGEELPQWLDWLDGIN